MQAAAKPEFADAVLAAGVLARVLRLVELACVQSEEEYAAASTERATFDVSALPAVLSGRANLFKQATWTVSALLKSGWVPRAGGRADATDGQEAGRGRDGTGVGLAALAGGPLGASAGVRRPGLTTPRRAQLDHDDPAVAANVTWCLADFAQCRPRRVLELGCCAKLLELVLHPNLPVRGAALRCACFMASGDAQGARVLLAKGFFVVVSGGKAAQG
jgi:hypothetical protein